MDYTTLKLYGMVIATFWIWNKSGKIRFFVESFLFADIIQEIV